MCDHHGGFLAGACHFFTNVADAEGAELHACRQGLLLARRLQVPKVVLETDCSVVVSKLIQEDMDRSFYGPLIEEIKELLRGFDEGMAQVVLERQIVLLIVWLRRAARIMCLEFGLVFHQLLL
jgi:hypothetical protein